MKYACQINQTLILYQLKGNLTSVTWKGTLQELVGQSGFSGLSLPSWCLIRAINPSHFLHFYYMYNFWCLWQKLETNRLKY